MKKVQIRQQADVVLARQAGREAAKELGFGLADQTRLATAISELARNVVQYADAGQCIITDESDEEFIRIRVVVEDHGPGIPDIERALRDGFSTGNGLGAGLPGTKRLVHEFRIESKPGHTRITVGMRKRRR